MVSSWRCVTAEKAESKGTDCSRIKGAFCQELGAHFDGVARTMEPSPERLIKLVQATIWLLGRKVAVSTVGIHLIKRVAARA